MKQFNQRKKFFGFILYIGIDKEVYLHSAEANLETGSDGEYFNIVFWDDDRSYWMQRKRDFLF